MRRSGGRLDAVLVVTVVAAGRAAAVEAQGAEPVVEAGSPPRRWTAALGHLLRHVADRRHHPDVLPRDVAVGADFGGGDLALRSVSALAEIVTVPVAYAAALALGPAARWPASRS